jgi:spore coat protein CotH
VGVAGCKAPLRDRELPADFDPPSRSEPPDDFDPSTLPGRGDGGFGGFGRSNPLVERFYANAEFEALYQEELTDLRADLYDRALADGILATWVDTLTEQATDVVDVSTITAEADTIADQFKAE